MTAVGINSTTDNLTATIINSTIVHLLNYSLFPVDNFTTIATNPTVASTTSATNPTVAFTATGDGLSTGNPAYCYSKGVYHITKINV